jgi:squalene synthase HpnC
LTFVVPSRITGADGESESLHVESALGFGGLLSAYIGAATSVATQASGENFPVASRLLPKRSRSQLMAIYEYARLVDDVGDEAPGDRGQQLDWLEAELRRTANGEATHPIFRRLTPVLDVAGIDPCLQLIEANRLDQKIRSYGTFEELRAYCMLSAAPVGRLVLSVFAALTPDRVAISDDVCCGLQLVEHLQDVGEDFGRGRVYLPMDDLARFDCTTSDLGERRASEPLRALIRFEAARAEALLGRGRALVASLAGRQRLAIVGFVAGGLAAVDAVREADCDVLAHHCRPSKQRFLQRALTVGIGRKRDRAW